MSRPPLAALSSIISNRIIGMQDLYGQPNKFLLAGRNSREAQLQQCNRSFLPFSLPPLLPCSFFPAACSLLVGRQGNNFSNIMGACAGCMGPNRRESNYKVNRLTENSPIKERVSVGELPSRHKERILEELNESKRRYEQGNLLGTLLHSPVLPDKQLSRLSHADSPELFPREAFLPARESHAHEELPRSSGMLKLRKVESTFVDRRPDSAAFLDENNERFLPERPLFVSEFRGEYERANSKVLAEIRLNKNEVVGLKRKGMPNIPELADEEAKTPNYIRDMRKQNGEDVRPTALECVPRQLPPAPRLNLRPYLKDL